MLASASFSYFTSAECHHSKQAQEICELPPLLTATVLTCEMETPSWSAGNEPRSPVSSDVDTATVEVACVMGRRAGFQLLAHHMQLSSKTSEQPVGIR